MRMLRGGLVVLAALAALVTLSAQAFAGPALVSKQVQWRDAAFANAQADTTFIQDESDTTRTVWIDTADWDWAALGANATSGGAINAKVFLVSSTMRTAATDTVYFTVEKGSFGGSPSDTTYGFNGTIAAATGSICLAPNGTAAYVLEGSLLIDVDTPSANNVWLAPRFRLRFAGDQSGSSPVFGGAKCFVVYPKRNESQ
jgi:hypothetical protein